MAHEQNVTARQGEAALAERLRRCREPRGRRPDDRSAAAEPAQVSFGQERMWLVDAMQPDSAVNNCGYAFRLRGPLDENALGAAIDELCRRHEVLRSIFVPRGDRLVLTVRAHRPGLMRRADLSHLPDPAGEAIARARAATAAPYLLDEEPPVRCLLFRLAAGDHLLVLCLHHAITDGWSESVINDEIAAHYDRRPLPELTMQYADYARAQRARDEAHGFDTGVRYWADRLAGATPVRLPFDRPAHRGVGQAGETLVLDFEAPAVDVFGRMLPAGTTLFTGLFSAFGVLLARCGDQTDLVIGVPVAGRDRPALEKLVGFFVNTVGLRLDLSGDPTFLEVLARVRGRVLDGLDHQDVPLERVVAEARPGREPGRQPLVQVLFQLHNVPARQLRLRNLRVTTEQIFPDVAALDLGLSVVADGSTVRGYWKYRTELFDPSTVVALHRALAAVIAEAGEDPRRRLSQFRLPRP